MSLIQRATRLNTGMSQALKSTSVAEDVGSGGMVDTTLNLVATSPEGISVDVVTRDITPANQHKLQLPGVRVQHVSEKYHRATVSVDSTDALSALARLPEVVSIAPAYKPLTMTGSVDSRAVQALRVDRAKQNFDASTPDVNLDGSGQKLGVLSDSFAQTAAVRDGDTSPAAGTTVPATLTGTLSQDSGDLPATVDLRRDDLDPAVATDEGAAMGELIHDLVPGAAMAFHTAFGGQAVFADGIDDLCEAAGAASTVVVDDIIYLAEPMYQDGIIAQAAANCVASGVPYFSSAGNNSNRGFRQAFVDVLPANDDVSNPGGNLPASGLDLHDWGGGDGYLDITIPAGASITVVLQWNQPFQSLNPASGAQVDLDLYLATSPDAAGIQNGFDAGLFSADNQGNTGAPSGDAIELLGVTNTGGAAGTLYLAIEHRNGSQGAIPQNATTPLEFRVVFFESGGRSTIQGINDATSAFGGPTIYGHAVAAGVTSVAAVPWFETPAFDPPEGLFSAPDMDPEPFTARGGPITIFFDPVGNYAPRDSFEPDIAAVDGNNTTFFGGPPGTSLDGEDDGIPNFFGTSAAAPNAAAVAALIKEYRPTLSVGEINQLMAATAVDVTGYRAARGVDDVTGPGLVDLNAALSLLTGRTGGGGGGGCSVLPKQTFDPLFAGFLILTGLYWLRRRQACHNIEFTG
jgi:hypothetical protein